MAKRRNGRRIEPTFDGPPARVGGGLSVSESDRVVPGRGGPRRKKAKPAKGRGARRAARNGGLFGLARRGVYWSCVLGLWGAIAVVGIVVYYGAQMPSATTWAVPDRPPNVRIVSVSDELVANRGVTGGQAVGLDEMSPYIPQALIAIEDRRFKSHFGVDPIGLARAFMENVVEGHVTQGGSTLTQQLAKNLFLEPDRTIERKVQEVLLALWLEHKFTKDQILQMYLNRMYFGSGAFGVEAASRRYFGKPASEVTLAQAALLAGLLKAPSRLSPARDPKAADRRAKVVLTAMRDQGMITDRQMETAISAKPTHAPSYWTGSENYVADSVMDALPDLIGEVRSDIVVHTTVDMTLQKDAETAVRDVEEKSGRKLKATQAALVSVDGTGAIRAMIGGVDYSQSQFNRVTDAHRQPGSAFKPFVYLAALERGNTPQSVRNDVPIRIGNWTPGNYGGKYHGRVTLTEALADSMNSVAAQLVMEVGPKSVVDVAQRLGIQSELKANASLALGTSEVTPLELAGAYVPFANGGYKPDVHLIDSITSASGKVLYRRKKGGEPRVVSPEVVGMMNYMMSETVKEGTGEHADFGWPAAGKTGTTQNSHDAWFVGYTRNLTTAVWFGNDDSSPMKGVTGGTLPARVWHDFMKPAHEGIHQAPLPGNYRPGFFPGMQRPDEPLVSQAPAQGGTGLPVQRVSGQGGHPVPAMDLGETSSIRRPVPSAPVGGAAPRRDRTILDVIFGR